MSTDATSPSPTTKKLGPTAITVLLTVVLTLMLLAFLIPAINSGPHQLPLAVAGSTEAIAAVEGQLSTASPDAFEIHSADSTDSAIAMVENREAIGAITLDPTGATITVASGAGAPYAALLRNIAAGMTAAGQPVTVNDVAPMAAADPAGMGLSSLLLPLIFGGMASAVLLGTQVHSTGARVAGATAVAVVGGLASALVLQTWFGAVEGNFWMLWAGLAAGILAISTSVLGLYAVMGFKGLGLGAVLMLFISNPLSGFATGPQWLPSGWGEFGQFMPMGAAGTILRSAAFFDERGIGAAAWVLLAWTLVGIALIWMGGDRRAHQE